MPPDVVTYLKGATLECALTWSESPLHSPGRFHLLLCNNLDCRKRFYSRRRIFFSFYKYVFSPLLYIEASLSQFPFSASLIHSFSFLILIIFGILCSYSFKSCLLVLLSSVFLRSSCCILGLVQYTANKSFQIVITYASGNQLCLCLKF